jgi:prepilin-type N-terminal cleavage/methylation domain-containing protein
MKRLAYTLVELLVVITILALLVVLVVVNYSEIVAKSRDRRRLNDLESIQLVIETYKFENKKIPEGATGAISVLLANKKDPKTQKRYLFLHYNDFKYELCALMETKRNIDKEWEQEGEWGQEIEIIRYNYCLYGDKVLRVTKI